MSPDRAVVHEIDWLEVFPWLRLARAIAVAYRPSMLLLALLGMTLTTAGWLGISQAYARYWTDDLVIKRQAAAYERSDVCVVPAAGVAAEAMVALTLAKCALEKFGGDSMTETLRNFAGYKKQLQEF